MLSVAECVWQSLGEISVHVNLICPVSWLAHLVILFLLSEGS